MPAEAIATLRRVNDGLRSTLVRLHPERSLCSTITPEDFSAIIGEISRARQCLQHLLPGTDAAVAVEKELMEYRDNLEKLKQFLPDLQGRLLAEKVRLETANHKLAAAAAWAQANEKTL
jgi:hypothetical protein